MIPLERPEGQRFATADFRLNESPLVAELHDRWRSALRENRLPGFWDLQLWERPALLPFVSVVTINRKVFRVRYRFVGEAVKQYCHKDLAGVYLDEWNFTSARWVESIYRQVSETRQPLFGYDSWILHDGTPASSRFGVFPLSDSGSEATSCVAIDEYQGTLADSTPGFFQVAKTNLVPDAYPRTTSLDFLGYCRESTAALYAYWNDKRGRRFAPRPEDLDFAELAPWHAGLLFVDVARGSGRLTYRWAGARSCAARGYDPTGMTVEEAYVGRSVDAALQNYRLIIEDHAVVYDWDHAPARSGLKREEEALGLPLSSDGVSVDRIMVYVEFEDRA